MKRVPLRKNGSSLTLTSSTRPRSSRSASGASARTSTSSRHSWRTRWTDGEERWGKCALMTFTTAELVGALAKQWFGCLPEWLVMTEPLLHQDCDILLSLKSAACLPMSGLDNPPTKRGARFRHRRPAIRHPATKPCDECSSATAAHTPQPRSFASRAATIQPCGEAESRAFMDSAEGFSPSFLSPASGLLLLLPGTLPR